jgi:hypothetical protein
MNAISPSVQAVVDLFADPLRDVRFADVDAATLAEMAASTQAAAEVVATAEGEVTRARRALQDRQDALLLHAQRALAYARVYAEADPAMTEKLEQIALPRAARRPRAEGDALVLQPDPGLRQRSPEGSKRTRGPARKSTHEEATFATGPALESTMTEETRLSGTG